MVPWLSGKLAALLSVGAFMAAGTLGVAAADGVGGRGPINDVLSSLGVVPGNSASPLVEGGQGSSTGNHGSHVSSAVHRAIASTTPGPGRGIAVSQAACEAAHDRTTLPQGAQNAPGQAKKTATPKSCVHPNADGTPGNGASAQATPTPTTIVTTTVATDTEPATEEEPSSPGRSGEEHGKPENPGNRGNSNAGAAPAGTPVAGPGQSSNAPGHSNQPSNAGGSSNAGGGNAGGSNAGGPPQSPPGRPSTLPNSSGGQGGQGQGQGGQNQGGQGGGGQGNRR